MYSSTTTRSQESCKPRTKYTPESQSPNGFTHEEAIDVHIGDLYLSLTVEEANSLRAGIDKALTARADHLEKAALAA